MKPERVLDLSFWTRLQNLSGGGSEDALMRGRLSASRHAAERYELWRRPVSVSLEMLSSSWMGRSHITIGYVKTLRVEAYLLIDTSVELLHSHGPSFALLTPRRASHAPSARCAGGLRCLIRFEGWPYGPSYGPYETFDRMDDRMQLVTLSGLPVEYEEDSDSNSVTLSVTQVQEPTAIYRKVS